MLIDSQLVKKGLYSFDFLFDYSIILLSSPNGEWTIFTGDQLGVIFASKIFQTYKLSGQPIDRLAMVASTVSSKMLAQMAEVEGFKFSECLTGMNLYLLSLYHPIFVNIGFKFIGNTAFQLSKKGFNVLFSYEEAIGFMFGHYILDKDGIAATVCDCINLLSVYI